jgi:acetyl esterase/lipase
MSTGRARHRVTAVNAGLLLLTAAAAACGSGSTPASPATTGATTAARPPISVEYSPGLTEDIYVPQHKGRVPLVVMVPGGGWMTADPAGLAGLAAGLAAAGIAAAPTHIRAAADGVRYPVPVDDVLCAVATAASEVRSRGFTPDPVAVLGHSSGAHLAALAVLAVDDYSPACTSPVVKPNALIGLSGPYDISQVPDLASALLGTDPSDDPARWQAANPVNRANLRPDVPVLLLHGDADELVSVGYTTHFAQALKDAGHPTTVQIVPGADHQSIYTSAVSSERIASWLLTESSSGPTARHTACTSSQRGRHAAAQATDAGVQSGPSCRPTAANHDRSRMRTQWPQPRP